MDGNDFPPNWQQDSTIFLDQDTGKFLKIDPENEETFLQWNPQGKNWQEQVESTSSSSRKPQMTAKRPNPPPPSDLLDDPDETIRPAAKKSRTKKKGKEAAAAASVRKNTGVFVSNLPLDVTVQELNAYFSRCGIIMEDLQAAVASKYKTMASSSSSSSSAPKSNSLPHEPVPKIKLYRTEDGVFKGEALIIYFKEESVDLAIQLLDDSELRPGHRISVQQAVFSNDPNKKSGLNRDERRLLKSKFMNMEKKLGWLEKGQATSKDEEKRIEKLAKTVILSQMFTPEQIQSDISLLAEIKSDLMEECEKLGTVTKIDIYDLSKEGQCSVRFLEKESALACVQLMNGRFFDGRRVEAHQCLDQSEMGALKRLMSKADTDDKEEEERLEEFGKWLENQ